MPCDRGARAYYHERLRIAAQSKSQKIGASYNAGSPLRQAKSDTHAHIRNRVAKDSASAAKPETGLRSVSTQSPLATPGRTHNGNQPTAPVLLRTRWK